MEKSRAGMKPELPLFALSHSVSQGSVSISCFPHSVTAHLQEPLPARSEKEEEEDSNTACRVQRNKSLSHALLLSA